MRLQGLMDSRVKALRLSSESRASMADPFAKLDVLTFNMYQVFMIFTFPVLHPPLGTAALPLSNATTIAHPFPLPSLWHSFVSSFPMAP